MEALLQMAGLKNLSTAELQRELDRRERGADKLLAKREKLMAQVEEIDAELAALGSMATGGSSRKGRRGRPARSATSTPKRRRAKNDISLPDAIAAAMDVRAVVSPQEAARLVKANGFKTTSKNFNMMVSNALAKDKRFKRLSRGQYERIA
jgi:hypothetical protein